MMLILASLLQQAAQPVQCIAEVRNVSCTARGQPGLPIQQARQVKISEARWWKAGRHGLWG